MDFILVCLVCVALYGHYRMFVANTKILTELSDINYKISKMQDQKVRVKL